VSALWRARQVARGRGSNHRELVQVGAGKMHRESGCKAGRTGDSQRADGEWCRAGEDHEGGREKRRSGGLCQGKMEGEGGEEDEREAVEVLSPQSRRPGRRWQTAGVSGATGRRVCRKGSRERLKGEQKCLT